MSVDDGRPSSADDALLAAFARANAENERRAKDYAEFFDAVGVKRDCPCCGNQSWNVVGGGVRSIPALIYVQDENVDPMNRPATGASLTIAAICKNCGFIRQHMESVYIEWKARGGVDE